MSAEEALIEIVYRYDPAREPLPPPRGAREATERLIEGNGAVARFWRDAAESSGTRRDVIPFRPDLWSEGIPAQEPFAAIVSCSDARVPTELIFRQTLNDLFVVRLAGNVISAEGIGSLAYAVQHLAANLSLLVVLGHSGCGAVTAAVDAYLAPEKYPQVPPNIGLVSLVDRIQQSVRVAAMALENVTGRIVSLAQRKELIDLAVPLHAALGAMSLQKLVREIIDSDCDVVFGVYDLSTHVVWAPGADGDEVQLESGLQSAPESMDSIARLADKLLRR